MKSIALALFGLLTIPTLAAAQNTMPSPSPVPHRADRSNEFVATTAADRVTYSAAVVGTSTPIRMTDIVRLCQDMDGCSIRMAMFNWDGTGRVASRDFLFFYNPATRGHRASAVVPIGAGGDLGGDGQGFDANGTVEHDAQAWACYFTDGEYSASLGTDLAAGFNLLLWNQYPAAVCWMTIIE